jgi:hypothetical protein
MFELASDRIVLLLHEVIETNFDRDDDEVGYNRRNIL